MKILQTIEDLRARFYKKTTDFKFVKFCTLTVMLIYIPLLIIGIIVAAFLDPDGYTIWTNWISDLGSINHTPAPFLYDIACIVAGSLTVPLTFYMEKLLAPLPESEKEIPKSTRLRFRLGSYAFFFNIIGNISYIGVGIFSGDRDYYGLHTTTSTLAFGGFILGAFFAGWMIVLYRTKVPKGIGIYGIVGPFTTAIIYLLINMTDSPLDKLFEWMMLFAILAWLIPLALSVFHNKD